MPRPGRRPGTPETRHEILEAARAEFAAQGYRGATIRRIAAAAGVDPALIMHYFGTKERLFTASLELPVNPADVIRTLFAGDPDTFGERMVTTLLTIWDTTADRSPLIAILRSAVDEGPVAKTVAEYLETSIIGTFVEMLPGEDAPLRATLIGSQLFGIIVGRYILAIEPLASADRDQLVAAFGPTMQRYAFGEL